MAGGPKAYSASSSGVGGAFELQRAAYPPKYPHSIPNTQCARHCSNSFDLRLIQASPHPCDADATLCPLDRWGTETPSKSVISPRSPTVPVGESLHLNTSSMTSELHSTLMPCTDPEPRARTRQPAISIRPQFCPFSGEKNGVTEGK